MLSYYITMYYLNQVFEGGCKWIDIIFQHWLVVDVFGYILHDLFNFNLVKNRFLMIAYIADSGESLAYKSNNNNAINKLINKTADKKQIQ